MCSGFIQVPNLNLPSAATVTCISPDMYICVCVCVGGGCTGVCVWPKVRANVWVRHKCSYNWKSTQSPNMGLNTNFCVCVRERDYL